MRIGEFAKRSGSKVETIRYYEQQGLLPAPDRTVAGYRVYGPEDVARLGFITRSRALGFSIAEIRELMSLEENPALSCEQVDEVARRHRDQVRIKLAQLKRLDEALGELITGCHGGQRADCAILHALQRAESGSPQQ